MAKQNNSGIYQLENGNWGFRYGLVVDGKTVWRKKVRDESGNILKNKTAAIRARERAIIRERTEKKPTQQLRNKKLFGYRYLQ